MTPVRVKPWPRTVDTRHVRLPTTRRSGVLLAVLVLSALTGVGAYALTRPPAQVTIGAAGDIACGPDKPEFASGSPRVCQQQATSDLLVTRHLDAVLPLGDNQYDGGLDAYRRSYGPSWGRLNALVHPVPGNHEYLYDQARGYWEYFGSAAGEPGKGWYSFDLGRWHLIALNGTCDRIDCGPHSEEVTWLRRDLARNHRTCVLAYWHYPLFSGGEGANEVSEDGARGTPGQANLGDTRVRPLVRALYDAGADVILNGHSHTYERFAPMRPDGTVDPERGVRQFVVGTGGRSHYVNHAVPGQEVGDDTRFGVLIMTLRPDGYDWNFVPTTPGGFNDQGSGSCH